MAVLDENGLRRTLTDLRAVLYTSEETDTELALKVTAPTTTGTSGQVLRTNGDGTTSWSNDASAQQIKADVEEWLEENIDPDVSGIDNTLSIEGAAADAKAAGSIVKVSTTQPSESTNKLWIKDGGETEYSVPTMDEFTSLSQAIDTLPTSETGEEWANKEELNTELVGQFVGEVDRMFSTGLPQESTMGRVITQLALGNGLLNDLYLGMEVS